MLQQRDQRLENLGENSTQNTAHTLIEDTNMENEDDSEKYKATLVAKGL
jgi:hypothetical protein